MGIYCFITPVSLNVWDFPFFTEFNCPPYDGGMVFLFYVFILLASVYI